MSVLSPDALEDLPWQRWYLRPGAGEEAEFARLRREGLLRLVIADVHVPADSRESLLLRAGAVSAALPPAVRERILVVTHATAWWVHTGRRPDGDDGPPNSVEIAWPRRHGGTVTPPVVVRAGRLDPRHVSRLGPIWLTMPARTVVDLLRCDDRSELAPGALADDVGVCLHEVAACARQVSGLPGLTLARRRIAAALRQAGGAITGSAGPCGCP